MRSKQSIFLCAYLGMLLFGASLVTLGSVAPKLQEKFLLDSISFGALFSILPLGILAGSLLFGPLADRYGYKIVLTTSGLFMFVGFQGIAYAYTVGILKICVFLFGVAGGAINGSSNAVVSDVSERNKSASLSLVGVFFAVGALGMPFILGILEKTFSFERVVATVGYVALISTVLFLITRFPVAKQVQGLPLSQLRKLLNDKVLLIVGFFLFCQCSFEALINNWTTTYLLESNGIPIQKALYALSLYVAGMAATRIVLGKALQKISAGTILLVSIALLLAGCFILQLTSTYALSVAALVIIGSGLAAGFPVALGFVGTRYTAVSGTAFSIVISIGLIGSMALNYSMGFIADQYGIHHFTTMAFVLTGGMLVFSLLINKQT